MGPVLGPETCVARARAPALWDTSARCLGKAAETPEKL